MFTDNEVPYPNDKLTLGKYLGPSTNIGPFMTGKILKEDGQIVSRTTVHHLTDELLNSPTHKDSRVEFYKAIEAIMGDSVAPADFPIDVAYELNAFQEMDQFSTPTHELYEDEQQVDVSSLDREDIKEELFDQYLNANVTLPKDGHIRTTRVKRQSINVGDRPVGTPHENPMMYTRE